MVVFDLSVCSNTILYYLYSEDNAHNDNTIQTFTQAYFNTLIGNNNIFDITYSQHNIININYVSVLSNI